MNGHGEPLIFDDHEHAYRNAAERARTKTNGEEADAGLSRKR
jgi:hypothetical protein